jgi:hypothetical protein
LHTFFKANPQVFRGFFACRGSGVFRIFFAAIPKEIAGSTEEKSGVE